MICLGFVAVKIAPCLYVNLDTEVYVVIHVDDVMAVGPKHHLHKFQEDLGEIYETAAEMIGLGPGEARSGKFLGTQDRSQAGWCDLDRAFAHGGGVS